jgi:predicted dienelactone hydrolase
MWAMVLLAACAPEAEPPPIEVPWTAPGEPGPFAPGVTHLVVDDPRGGVIDVEVWYPAKPAEGATPDPYEELPITLGSYRDAPPVREFGAFPLLAFSHGFGGIRYQSATLTEHLASHGYVVVAPDHEGTILLFLDWDEMDRHILERPDDVRFAVDEVLRRSEGGDPLLGGMVAGDRYALVGHSFGSVTSLALGGAEPDFAAAAQACDGGDYQGCDYLPDIDPADVAGHGTRDERVEAMVLMSVGGWYAFGADGANLANTVPSLVLGGDADDVLSYQPEQIPTYERLGTPTALGTLAAAGHYAAFSDMCTLIPVFEDCVGAEEGFLSAEEGQAITRHLVTAWIGARWRGDARDEAALSSEALAGFGPLSWTSR